MNVTTVLGDVDASSLGITLTHEHLLIDLFRVFQPNRNLLLNDVDLAAAELQHYADAGGGTLVELTTPDLGRDPAALVDIARRTGVQIVMGAGRYRERFYEPELWRMSTAELTDALVREVREGVDGVRPGIFGEIGTHEDFVSPVEERVHRAVARAHAETGLTISTHSNASAVGLNQLDLFADEGVDLRRVVVGHCDTHPFTHYHLEILKRGAYVQFDTVRGNFPYETRRQVSQLLTLIGHGYLDRLLISQDICDKTWYRVYGGNGYAFVLERFVDLLRDAGLSQEQLDVLFVENPRRMLSGEV